LSFKVLQYEIETTERDLKTLNSSVSDFVGYSGQQILDIG